MPYTAAERVRNSATELSALWREFLAHENLPPLPQSSCVFMGRVLQSGRNMRHPAQSGSGLLKAPTGIEGFDQITFGGLPQGRPTLVCGGPGCGKTLFGLEFLIRGATQFNEPGVCLSFEETAEELSRNVASLGFDVDRLVASNKLSIDYIFIERG